MLFKPGTQLYAYEVAREAGAKVLYINYMGANFIPNVAENAEVMSRTIGLLIEASGVSRIVFVQQRNYSYDSQETFMLQEIANLYVYLTKQEKILSPSKLSVLNTQYLSQRYNDLGYLLMILKSDPIACFIELERFLELERGNLEKVPESIKFDQLNYVKLLEKFYGLLKNSELIRKAEKYLKDYDYSRKIYYNFFRPEIIPNFTFTRLVSSLPKDAEIVDQYEIGDDFDKSTVTILKREQDAKYLYHLMPPEYSLEEDLQSLVNLARNVLIEHQPKAEEFTDPEKTRQVFFNVSRDLLRDLAESKKVKIDYENLNKLAKILVRHTIGFGLIEVLLQDKNLHDIVLNSPISINPVFLRHQEFDECITNIIPSKEDADSWAAKFRMISGRPLDEANPILDTDLRLGDVRARIAVIQQPLSPAGLAYAVRRHRESPWTLPLFIKNKMVNSFSAGLFSFLIDGSRTILVAGTRSSGKTSLLGALMLEIMPKFRIICLEDTLELPVEAIRKLNYDIQRMKVRSSLLKESAEIGADEGIRTSLRLGDSSLIVGEVRSSIRGNEEVVIVNNGVMDRVKISELENKNLNKIYVPTVGFDLKVKLSKLTDFVKHPKRKKLLRIKTKTGREATVTYDHSLFAPTKDFEIAPIECKELKVGSQVVIPGYMPCGFNNLNFINVFNYLPEFRVKNFENDVRKAIDNLGWRKATEICNIATGDIYNYFRTTQKTNIPFSSFTSLMDVANIGYDFRSLEVKKGTSLPLPAFIPVNEDFCRFLGYYVSEGYYSLKEKNGGNVVITNSNPEIMADLSKICLELFKISPKKRIVKGLGTSVQHRISCLPLAKLISKLGCGRTCYEKRVPSVIFGLSKEKISSFLRGLYSGDGSFTSSKGAGNCVRYFSTSKKLVEDVSYLLLNFGIVGKIYEKKQIGIGSKNIWILEFKDRKMVKTFMEEIGFVRKVSEMIIKKEAHTTANSVRFDKEKLKEHLIKHPRKYRHLFRFLRCSKNYLEKVVSDPECEVSEKLRRFALGDFFIDEIKEIKEIELDEEEYVYDLSVEPTENFVGGFGGILLHNTEAKALYEAMRVGALANVVAGTIHGASPYGVFDRVVNDLEVPITSFKATDCVIVCNPVKTPDGLKSVKRVIQLAEVRKHWTKDPEEEGGFVDLLKYNVDKDEIEASDELINGDSEVIKSIAAGVKGWAGNWDAVYDNILLRGKVKQELVDFSNKVGKPEILEAEFNSLSNNMFHQFSKEVQEEIGLPMSDRVFPMWQKWLKKEVKRRKI